MEIDDQGYSNFADEQSADLVIQIQLDDINAQAAASKGKSPEGQISDAELAFQLYKQDLEEYNSFLFDRRMTRSIAFAVQVDGDVLTDTVMEDASTARDRDIAQSLQAGSNVSNLDTRNDTSEHLFPDDEFLEKLAALYVYGVGDGKEVLFAADDGSEVVPESSTWAASRPTRPTSMKRRCVACGEDKLFFNVARVPCRHEYCRECLGELYQASLTDDSLFPPRCCRQQIPVATVQVFLDSQLVGKYQRKKIEFDTPNRTYCHSQACSAFIRTENIKGEIATCTECDLRTCTSCKLLAHDGRDCPNDVGLQQVLQLATAHGWQRCYSCWRLVELDHGCNHITCRCGAQFCYICGVQWKTCTCDQWDEHRLLERAQQIINRDQEPVAAVQIIEDAPLDLPPVYEPMADERAPIQPPPEEPPLEDEPRSIAQAIAVIPQIPAEVQSPRDLLIRQTMRDLMANHECDHSNWRWVSGAHQCEECYHVLPQYIFECRQCRLQACNRCRRHRL